MSFRLSLPRVHDGSNGVVFEREVVLPPKRTVMCLFAKGDDADAPEYVSSKGNEEVSKTTNQTAWVSLLYRGAR